jgi:hypothetical protein
MRQFSTNNAFINIANRETDIPNPSNPVKPYKRFERIFKTTM